MSLVLADLTFEEGTANMGGLGGTIYAIPASDVDSIPAPDADTLTVSADIVCKSGKKFSEFYFTNETGELKETEVGERDGGSFEAMLEWFYPTITDEGLRAKSNFANGGFIFVVEDGNGVRRIIGSKQHPAYREPGDINAGKAPKDRRGLTFKFKAASPTPALIYTGNVPLVAAP